MSPAASPEIQSPASSSKDEGEVWSEFYRVTRRQYFRWKGIFREAKVEWRKEQPEWLVQNWPGGRVPTAVKLAVLRAGGSAEPSPPRLVRDTPIQSDSVGIIPALKFQFSEAVEAAKAQVDYWRRQAEMARAGQNNALVQSVGTQLENASEALRKVMLSEAKIASLNGDTLDRATVEAEVRAFNLSIKRHLTQGIAEALAVEFPTHPGLYEMVVSAYETAAARLVEQELAA